TADVGALVPRQADPAQGLEDHGLAVGARPGPIGVLDAEDELAAVLARKDVVEQRDVRRAHVGIAGGRRGDANPDWSGRSGDAVTRRGHAARLVTRRDTLE